MKNKVEPDLKVFKNPMTHFSKSMSLYSTSYLINTDLSILKSKFVNSNKNYGVSGEFEDDILTFGIEKIEWMKEVCIKKFKEPLIYSKLPYLFSEAYLNRSSPKNLTDESILEFSLEYYIVDGVTFCEEGKVEFGRKKYME